MATLRLSAVSNELQALRHRPPFDTMEEPALEFLASRLLPASYEAGKDIVVPDRSVARRFHIVVSGRVDTTPTRPYELSDEPYPTLGPGECFPIGALLIGGHVTSEYRAMERTHCLELDGADFH